MNSLNSTITAAKQAAKRKEYDEAVSILDSVSTEAELSAEYFLLKSRFIQLGETNKYELQDAADCLLKAHEIAPSDTEVLIDLGFLNSRVLANEEKARAFFSQACDLLREQYAETLVGLAEMIDHTPRLADEAIETELTKLRDAVAKRL